jgi:two-component system chemotaxis response regulator CheY
MLSGHGVSDTAEAADGQQAIEMVSDSDYDLVLLDWNMPKVAGIDALKKIRQDGNKVPVIMVTTESEKTRMITALKAGANNYVIKPFDQETLLGKIQQALGTEFG